MTDHFHFIPPSIGDTWLIWATTCLKKSLLNTILENIPQILPQDTPENIIGMYRNTVENLRKQASNHKDIGYIGLFQIHRKL